ncbi:MAG: T9SS type A sorting domain-containing protein [Bacteroidia bacterium]|nr:T9SS type A sorting domain-containing protein [Bacteroidia bacterium]
MRVYPNPSSGKISIAVPVMQNRSKIEVYAGDGKLVAELDGNGGFVEADLSFLPEGIYLIALNEGGVRVSSLKWVKTRS